MKKYLFVGLGLLLASCSQNTEKSNSASVTNDSIPAHIFKMDSLSNLIAQDSLQAELYFERAHFHIENNDVNSAAFDFQKALQLDSTKAEYWYSFGELNYITNDSRTARDNWERCAKLDPENIDCRLSLAEMYLAVGELKLGQQKLNEVLKFDARNAGALFLTGNIALAQKDTVKAVKYVQSAINENQELFAAYDLLGVLYSGKGDLLAIDYFNAALNLRPYRYDIHYKVGMFYQTLEAYDAAIEAYHRVLEINPEHKSSLHNIAVIAVFAGDYPRAIDNFTKAIANDMSYLEAYFGRAYAYELSKEIVKAESDYRTCLMIEPSYLPAIDALKRIGK